jgi:hypothetical protein
MSALTLLPTPHSAISAISVISAFSVIPTTGTAKRFDKSSRCLFQLLFILLILVNLNLN